MVNYVYMGQFIYSFIIPYIIPLSELKSACATLSNKSCESVLCEYIFVIQTDYGYIIIQLLSTGTYNILV